jgi:hypothetical protein
VLCLTLAPASRGAGQKQLYAGSLETGCIKTGQLEYARFMLVKRRCQLTSGRTIDRLVVETMGLTDLAPVIPVWTMGSACIRSLTRSPCGRRRHIVNQLHSEQARKQLAFAGVVRHGAAAGAGLSRLNASLSNRADRRRRACGSPGHIGPAAERRELTYAARVMARVLR